MEVVRSCQGDPKIDRRDATSTGGGKGGKCVCSSVCGIVCLGARGRGRQQLKSRERKEAEERAIRCTQC